MLVPRRLTNNAAESSMERLRETSLYWQRPYGWRAGTRYIEPDLPVGMEKFQALLSAPEAAGSLQARDPLLRRKDYVVRRG